MRGKTVSITMPVPIIEYYEKLAKERGMSRSAMIVKIIMADYEEKIHKTSEVMDVTPSNP